MQLKKYLPLFLCLFYSTIYAAERASSIGSTSLALIVYESQTRSSSSTGGSGSSRTNSAILEHVIGKKDGGLEVQYSFPQSDIPKIEAWKLPARALIVPGSSIELLNESEISKRLDNFLDENPEIRERCGGVVFTWTAFDIHCNTDHVINLIESYNLHLGALHEGKLYEEKDTIAPASLKRVSVDENNLVYEVELILDPIYLQKEYKKTMEQVAEITGENVSSVMNSSLKLTDNEKPKFSGIRLVTIETIPSGHVVKIQRETTTIIIGGGTFRETRTQNEILKRQEVE